MAIYLDVALIILALMEIGLVMVQTKGGGLGSIFGGDGGVYRTRRGVENTIFNLTIVVSVLFLSVSFLTALIGQP
jgi:preprotein translocase subunit SecG